MGRLARLLTVGSALLVASVTSSVVRAHSDIDYTVPTDGAAVGDVVAEITVAFTEPVTLLGPGFEVLDPQGRVVVPFAVTDDDIVFRLQLDPPLGGGLVAVKYTVAAEDGHTIDGNFTFTVAADAPVVTEPPPTSSPNPPSTEAPATTPVTAAEVEATSPPDDAAPATAAPSTPEPTRPPITAADEQAAGDVDAEPVDPDADADADDDDDDDDDGSPTTLILIGLGSIVAAAFAFVLIRSRSAG